MKQSYVHDCSRQRCETNAISHGKKCAEVQWTLFLVGGDVEVEIGIDDRSDVVLRTV